MLVLCLNERMYRHIFHDLVLVGASFSFFELHRHYKIPLSGGFKCMGWEILQLSLFSSEMVRDRTIVTTEH